MENEIPTINELEKTCGKFIQVAVKGKNYFRFGPGENLHGEIFLNLLNELKINYETKKETCRDIDENVYEVDIPLIKNEFYELVGAGHFEVIDKKVKLYGKSTSYQKYPHQEHAQKISKLTGIVFVIEN